MEHHCPILRMIEVHGGRLRDIERVQHSFRVSAILSSYFSITVYLVWDPFSFLLIMRLVYLPGLWLLIILNIYHLYLGMVVLVLVHQSTEWQETHCSMAGYLIIIGGVKFLWSYSNLLLMVWFQPPPSSILINLILLVPCIWSFQRLNMHAIMQGERSYMHTCN